MHLSYDSGNDKPMPEIAYCPQNAEMWPREMPVRDILLFSCSLHGTSPHDFEDSFNGLGLTMLYDKPFGVLSGGQQQRVNIAACIVRSAPALILLDEPLASLDEENAIAALKVLQNLPVKHAFILTAHQSGSMVRKHFDRILHFDVDNKVLGSSGDASLTHKLPKADAVVESVHRDGPKKIFSTVRAALILWHGQFYAQPYLEVAMVLFSAISGVLTGFIGRPSLTQDVVETIHSVRAPIYASFMPFGITFLTSLCVAVVYATREQALIQNFHPQKSLQSWEFLSVALFRSVFRRWLGCVCHFLFGYVLLVLGHIGLCPFPPTHQSAVLHYHGQFRLDIVNL